MIPGGQMPGQGSMLGPESLLALLAGAGLGQLAGTPQQASMGSEMPGQQPAGPQGAAKGEGADVGQSSMNSLLPQLLQMLTSAGPAGAGGIPGVGKGGSQPAQGAQGAASAQEPIAMSVLRMLGMTRPGGPVG